MAFCTNCGSIMNIDDAKSHICSPDDIPPKGKMKKHGEKNFVDVS